ncbi:nitrite reductase small subunit NirD [Cellulomonas sp. URHE0023]|uniref:nitrite reductase small subunit NirD n=1 Tax=Cellulomonas sp. URHE0023 TaxID=1380354 RepID=UPI0005501F62|nr:nitrite reductase small subunit NirD [Cellulomonas sp. URHE0023]
MTALDVAPAVSGTGSWTVLCRLSDLAPERGAAALLSDGTQVAVFRLRDERVFAVQQHDPFSDAYVISRGIVGSRRIDDVDVPTVASPMYKQVFALATGECLDVAGKTPTRGLPPDLRPWPVRVRDGFVEVVS